MWSGSLGDELVSQWACPTSRWASALQRRCRDVDVSRPLGLAPARACRNEYEGEISERIIKEKYSGMLELGRTLQAPGPYPSVPHRAAFLHTVWQQAANAGSDEHGGIPLMTSNQSGYLGVLASLNVLSTNRPRLLIMGNNEPDVDFDGTTRAPFIVIDNNTVMLSCPTAAVLLQAQYGIIMASGNAAARTVLQQLGPEGSLFLLLSLQDVVDRRVFDPLGQVRALVRRPKPSALSPPTISCSDPPSAAGS